jgi:glycogen phosphorylase
VAIESEGSAFEYDKIGMDAGSMKRSLANRLVYTIGKDPLIATDQDWYYSLAYSVRDRLIQHMMETMRTYDQTGTKQVYYLSMEFLIGRILTNSLLNLKFQEECHKALYEMGLHLEKLRNVEVEAALGNGGLGRLAACFLDSMATLNLPGHGYGIRYEYGMFKQEIEGGYQLEHPENWLRYGNPWELPRPEVLYPIKFYGRVVEYRDERGHVRHHWVDTDDVMAMAYDIPIPGYGTTTINNLRLWSAKSTRDFDLRHFNEGNYIKSVEDKYESENLSKVLYPSDTTAIGRELRLRQQYFFVSASIQDILDSFLKSHDSFDQFPEKVAIQLNDTHPVLAIPELMRILIDTHRLDWDRAWAITVRTFAYTNHTLLLEALETWPVRLFETMFPRHLQIIYEINHRFLKEVIHHRPGDMELVRRMSLIRESGERRIRMAHLAVVGSHKVNGVAKLHTQLMKETTFAEFDRLYPDRIISITNGITPRRWLNQSNPLLAKLISSRIGPEWITNLEHLNHLAPLAEDEQFQNEFWSIKRANKERLAGLIQDRLGVEVNVDSLFDVQIKRIHEYKRQLLNLLHIITFYNRLKSDPTVDRVPRTVIFAGKAAPGYAIAKLIIKLMHDVADIVNNDPMIGDRLKVLFIPNYDVSTAEIIIPACDLSEQISTAGTEAAGTGNMKMAINGGLIIGTLDGANVEIREEVGKDNVFVFGLTPEQAFVLRHSGYDPWQYYHSNTELKQILDMIASGYFSPDCPHRFRPIVDALTRDGDRYLLLADYDSYIACQERVDGVYRNKQEWIRRAILNVAHMGKFSSDRTVREYAEKIWNLRPIQ